MTLFRVVFDLAVAGLWIRTLVVLAGRPARRWRTGRWGKAGSLVAAVALFSVWFGLLLPWGAAVVWWRVVVRDRDPFELPMADGRPMP